MPLATRLVLHASKWTGAVAASRWARRRRVVILTYHGVMPAEDITSAYLCRNVVEAAEFERQMAFLSSHYRCLALSEVVRLWRDGRTLPDRTVAVTFDDGFRNNRTLALPILKRYGIPATIFLTTGFIGQPQAMLWTERIAWMLCTTPSADVTLSLPAGPVTLHLGDEASREQASRTLLRTLKALSQDARDRVSDQLQHVLPLPAEGPSPSRYAFLDWSEARSMLADQVEFGAHTVTHPILSTLPDGASELEIASSKTTIEAHLGVRCVSLAYPNGTPADFSVREQDAARRAGFLCAVTQIAGTNAADRNPFELRRFGVGLACTGPLFEAQASGLWSTLSGVVGRA